MYICNLDHQFQYSHMFITDDCEMNSSLEDLITENWKRLQEVTFNTPEDDDHLADAVDHSSSDLTESWERSEGIFSPPSSPEVVVSEGRLLLPLPPISPSPSSESSDVSTE